MEKQAAGDKCDIGIRIDFHLAMKCIVRLMLKVDQKSLGVTGFILTELNIMSTQITEKIKEFWEKYEYKIVILIGFCLVSAISFEFGVLQGQKWQAKPLVIEKPADTSAGQESANPANSEALATTKTASTQSSASKTASAQNAPASTSGCAYVGSKNSNKFYLPTCSYAKRVKPENLACYTSEQDAISKGKIKSDCK